ncbi:hypothetical protein G6O69_30650 [Pseudenhygromyxa sp. WMMC2535]|uniref:hypothetical protein n=1 Tax=Pseudenhygromyxa sp. WMMC2535 TaxID=2712867 RepID=UPI00155649B7|nr:hypothetical protein [Pseudenhygromyxa sp. WMMC2535]NVB42223.1 hypothetical protein [Pseudenhygromyxa sp. WMMC2535]
MARRPELSRGRGRGRLFARAGGPRSVAAVALASTLFGCGGSLVRLAERGEWEAVDRRARAQKRTPTNKAARAWAQALVALGQIDEARAVLLRDFRTGAREPSLLALAKLEHQQGLLGVAAAHYVRALTIDLDLLAGDEDAAEICGLLMARAEAEAGLGEALAADTDMRRAALICPAQIDDAARTFMAELRPSAEAQARAQRAMASLDPAAGGTGGSSVVSEAALAEQLEIARKRSPRALAELAEAEGAALAPADVAMLLAAEFSGALGPGLVSPRQISAWIGERELAEIEAAIDALPDGVREYARLRVASARGGGEDDRQAWSVAAMRALEGEGSLERAKAWRVSAAIGNLSGAEFALTTSLRDTIPARVEADPGGESAGGAPASSDAQEAGSGALAGSPPPRSLAGHWSLRVPVERRSVDLLLTLARLLELRGEQAQALGLRLHVIAAGYEAGIAQIGPQAAAEVRRQLVMGNAWQALAIAEAVPGPLVDEVLPVVASLLALEGAAGDAVGIDAQAITEADRVAVRRALGDEWFAGWEPQLTNAMAGLDLRESGRCPRLGTWLDESAEAEAALREVGLDPARSRAALSEAFGAAAAPTTGAALAAALESDLALNCSGPVIVPLLFAGEHQVILSTLDERLTHAPELAGAQQQLHAELALAHGEQGRAEQLTLSAAGLAEDPRALWTRAVLAGKTYGAREYTLMALRGVLAHSEGLRDEDARRELLATRLRDVDSDAPLRAGGEGEGGSGAGSKGAAELRAQVSAYLREVPAQQRWSRRDRLLLEMAGEPRADARAWALLLEVLIDDAVRRSHPRSVAALERAALGASEEADPAVGTDGMGGMGSEGAIFAFLGDADALCELAPWARVDALDPQSIPILAGAMTACDPRGRSRAAAAMVALGRRDGELEALRARLLAGPLAVEADIDQLGVLRVTPAVPSEASILRLLAGLDL